MNRNLILIAIAAVAIVGIGVGRLLLPNLQSGPLTGSIAPTTTRVTQWTMTIESTPTPTPGPPVIIKVTGSYSPYRTWNDDIKVYDWYWNLHSVNTWDATSLPAGVKLQKVTWWITGTLKDGTTTTEVSQYMERLPGLFDDDPVQELPVSETITIDDGYSWLGCYSPEICPASDWEVGPPFTAGVTITTTDGTTYTKSTTLLR